MRQTSKSFYLAKDVRIVRAGNPNMKRGKDVRRAYLLLLAGPTSAEIELGERARSLW
jgi:hypothetical protein